MNLLTKYILLSFSIFAMGVFSQSRHILPSQQKKGANVNQEYFSTFHPSNGIIVNNNAIHNDKSGYTKRSPYHLYPNYNARIDKLNNRNRYRKFIRPSQSYKTASHTQFANNEENDSNSPRDYGRILYGIVPNYSGFYPFRYYPRPHPLPRRPKLTKQQRDEQFRKEYWRYISQDFPNFQLGTFDLGFGFFR